MDTNSKADVFTALAYLELPIASQQAITGLVRDQGMSVLTGFLLFEGNVDEDAGWAWKLNNIPSAQRAALERLKAERLRVKEEANGEAKKWWMDKVEAGRAEVQAESRASRAEQLATIKADRRRAWLIDHPGNNDADFEAIWPHMAEQLKQDESERYIEQRLGELRASGRQF
jgi:hypothetical protein